MNIVTVGGGTGCAVVNEALLRTNKVKFISSIATTFDNGGETQRRRLDSYGKEIAYSDAVRILVSLIDPKKEESPNVKAIKRWLLHRDLRDKVLGREIVNTFFDSKNGFLQIEKDLADLGIPLMGRVIPSSTVPSHIVFKTVSGMTYTGENHLDENRLSQDAVDDMTLVPKVNAYKPAAETIKNADLIILACGTMYGSLLCNFLPSGMKKAMADTKAKIYLVTNLVSTRNETDEITPLKLVQLIKKYTGRRINGLIVPHLTREEFEKKYKEAAYLYQIREYSSFLGWKDDEFTDLQKLKVEIIKHNAVNVIEVPQERKVIIRHDPSKLSKSLTEIL